MANESPIALIYGSDGVGGYEEKGTATKPLRVDPTGTTAQPITATALPLPTGAATAVKQPNFGSAGTPSADVVSVQGVANGTALPTTDVVGGTLAAAIPTKAALVGASDGTNLQALRARTTNPAPNNSEYGVVVRHVPQTCSTTSVAQVSSSATVKDLLVANSARMGATIFNQSTQLLYVKFGTGASATSYTVRMAANAYYEVPFGYTGVITGIWAAANGNAYVTELTL